jgi:hypothetical protein
MNVVYVTRLSQKQSLGVERSIPVDYPMSLIAMVRQKI